MTIGKRKGAAAKGSGAAPGNDANSKFGGAYSFNGSSSVVDVGDETTFTEINNPNQISTIVFWYKSSSSPSSTSDKIIGTVDTSASARGVMIGRYQGSGKGILELTSRDKSKLLALPGWGPKIIENLISNEDMLIKYKKNAFKFSKNNFFDHEKIINIINNILNNNA